MAKEDKKDTVAAPAPSAAAQQADADVTIVRINVGPGEFAVPNRELAPTPTAFLEGAQYRRRQRSDGKFYPIVFSTRDKLTGKVYDYVARGRLVDAGVMNTAGIVERRRVFKVIAQCIERTDALPAFTKPEERFEEVTE